MDTPQEIAEKENAKHLVPISESIEFKDVSFAYQEKTILSRINLRVKVGEIVAIVGPSGTGKTTLVNLLPRFYDPKEGRVLIDGADIRDVTLKSLRGQIGIVTQDTVLFNDTVLSNIAYGRSGTPQAQIEQAARIANAHDFIMKLPQ